MKKEKNVYPKGTDELVRIKDIKIPPEFQKTNPQRRKIIKACEYLHKHGNIDKPIKVIAETNERGKRNNIILIDEFTRYLSLLYNGFEYAPVRYISIEDYVAQ